MYTQNLDTAHSATPMPGPSGETGSTGADAAADVGAAESPAKRPMLNARQIAARLGVTDPLIYKLRRLRKMPVPYRIGTSTRWDADEIERWIETLREPAGADACNSSVGDSACGIPNGASAAGAPSAKRSRRGPRRTGEHDAISGLSTRSVSGGNQR
jgi:predicted DNA-binding transcriptional regulator AlpA